MTTKNNLNIVEAPLEESWRLLEQYMDIPEELRNESAWVKVLMGSGIADVGHIDEDGCPAPGVKAGRILLIVPANEEILQDIRSKGAEVPSGCWAWRGDHFGIQTQQNPEKALQSLRDEMIEPIREWLDTCGET